MKKFEKLIIASIDHEITGTTIEKLVQVKERFESEMIYIGIIPSARRVQDWLQGLCNTVSIPFMNHEILVWYSRELKRPIKENEEYKLIDNYWSNAGKTLYKMLYR